MCTVWDGVIKKKRPTRVSTLMAEGEQRSRHAQQADGEWMVVLTKVTRPVQGQDFMAEWIRHYRS